MILLMKTGKLHEKTKTYFTIFYKTCMRMWVFCLISYPLNPPNGGLFVYSRPTFDWLSYFFKAPHMRGWGVKSVRISDSVSPVQTRLLLLYPAFHWH
jgi:hypothetical protein